MNPKPRQRDIERYAVIFRIMSNRTMLYSARQKFDRLDALVATLCERNIQHLDWYDQMIYRDFTLIYADHYNLRWIVKRRSYGKRAKIRRYWTILDSCVDESRRLRILKRIEGLADEQ